MSAKICINRNGKETLIKGESNNNHFRFDCQEGHLVVNIRKLNISKKHNFKQLEIHQNGLQTSSYHFAGSGKTSRRIEFKELNEHDNTYNIQRKLNNAMKQKNEMGEDFFSEVEEL